MSADPLPRPLVQASGAHGPAGPPNPSGPQARLLADGRRLHLQHGPIDLIAEAWGGDGAVAQALDRAARRFATVLSELVAELPALREPAGACSRRFAGAVAARMAAAVQPLAQGGAVFLTPMAAVAGAVAEEVLSALVSGGGIAKAYVNNGGDAALHLAPGAALTLAIAGTGHGFADRLTLRAGDRARGIATSGWRGRSFSLGIADAVTVLARGAAAADAAATLVANAVDLPGHPAIVRRPACELSPDSDLGARSVTVDVGPLSPAESAAALETGLACARRLRTAGRIEGAALFLNGAWRVCGPLHLSGRSLEAREAADV